MEGLRTRDKIEYTDADIREAIQYLEKKYKKAVQTLENAKSLSLSNSVLKEIQSQINEIAKTLTTIQNYRIHHFEKVIATLSLEELNSFFTEEMETNQQLDLIEQRRKLEQELKEIDEQHSEPCLEKKEIEHQLAEVEYKLICWQAKTASNQKFLTEEKAMKSVLKTILSNYLGNIQDSSIREMEEEPLSDCIALLLLIKSLESSEAILTDPNYHAFFKRVAKKNAYTLSNVLGMDISENNLIPFLETEKKRLQQVTLFIAIQNVLNNIKKEIEKEIELERDRFPFIRKRKINKEVLFQDEKVVSLDAKYQKVVKEFFNKFKENHLFQIHFSHSNLEESHSLERGFKPKNFDELNGLIQTSWDSNIKADENTKRIFLNASTDFNNWDDYMKYLKVMQERLLTKLFTFSKNEDGYYIFCITEVEKEALLKIQGTIVSILDSIYYERKKMRMELENNDLEKEKREVLESILGSNSNISRESLAIYVENTKVEIKELLLHNPLLCSKLGIPLPIVNLDKTLAMLKEKWNIDAKLERLYTDGIDVLKEKKYPSLH